VLAIDGRLSHGSGSPLSAMASSISPMHPKQSRTPRLGINNPRLTIMGVRHIAHVTADPLPGVSAMPFAGFPSLSAWASANRGSSLRMSRQTSMHSLQMKTFGPAISLST
jgi:hypothetical protein